MDQGGVPAAGDITALSSSAGRKETLIDLLYLLVLFGLYTSALIYPLVGIILGIVLVTWSGTEATRRVGRTCLVLGVINAILVLLVLVLVVALGSLAAHLPFALWEGS
ncbi:MAG: hypothetical protein ABIK62_06610 [candidate division WOR-3 bacterium]